MLQYIDNIFITSALKHNIVLCNEEKVFTIKTEGVIPQLKPFKNITHKAHDGTKVNLAPKCDFSVFFIYESTFDQR